MMKIMDLLEKRKNYPITKDCDKWIDKILEDEINDDVWLIIVTSSLLDEGRMKYKERIVTKYFIAGVYNLETPFLKTYGRMSLVHLTKKTVNEMNMSIYKGQIFISRFKNNKEKNEMFSIPDRYASKYQRYLNELESWINDDNMPEDDVNGEYEYNTVLISEIIENKINPEYYSKKAVKVRTLLHNEKVYKLGDLVDIVMPGASKEQVGKIVKLENLKYRFDVAGLSEQQITNVTLQKNDILFPMTGNGKPFLVPDDIKETIYVGEHIFVLRCRDIQPAYLFLYLNSEVCQTIIDFKKIGTIIPRVTRKNVEEIPVIKPLKDKQEYKLEAYILTHIGERIYNANSDNMGEILSCWSALNKKKRIERIEDVLEIELLEKIKVYSTNQIQKLLHDDWIELNKCFGVGAYKATLILAGSILEALLIDWISELNGQDYFAEDYMVIRGKKQKRADLYDYIKEIKSIKESKGFNWNDEESKANEIREKRNLVHAKLGINSDEINEKTCRSIIEDLRCIIKSRGIEEY